MVCARVETYSHHLDHLGHVLFWSNEFNLVYKISVCDPDSDSSDNLNDNSHTGISAES